MALLLILPILVSGYLLCLKHPALFINLHKYEGQLLYLHVARLGLRCLVQAFVVVGVVSSIFSHVFNPTCWFAGTKVEFCRTTQHNWDYLEYIGSTVKEWGFAPTQGAADVLAFMLLVSAVAMTLPFILPKIGMWWLKKRKGLETPEAVKGYLTRDSARSSPLGLALIDAFTARTNIMLSMEDRKVYVGVLADVSEPSEVLGPNEEVTIIPLISGYRDKDTMKVVYTTDYASTAADVSPLILRQSNISSITTFSDEIRKAFAATDEGSEKSTKIEVPKGAQYCIWGGDGPGPSTPPSA